MGIQIASNTYLEALLLTPMHQMSIPHPATRTSLENWKLRWISLAIIIITRSILVLSMVMVVVMANNVDFSRKYQSSRR